MKLDCMLKRDLTGMILALGLAVGAVSSGSSFAGAKAVPLAAPGESIRVLGGPRGLGSAGNPIPLPGTEAIARGRSPIPPDDSLSIRVGPLRAGIYGSPGVASSPGDGIDRISDMWWTSLSDIYTCFGVGVAIGRFRVPYLEGGRVILHDPASVMEWGGSSGEYWTTSAKLAIRF